MFKILWEQFLLNALGRRACYNRQHYPAMAVFAHDFIGAQIYVHGRYEKHELENLRPIIAPLLKGSVVLDVGANIGNHALYFAGMAGEVHCFEPNPRTAALLTFNTADHAAIMVHNFGLSAKADTLEAFVPAANAGGATLGLKEGVDGKRISFNLERFDNLALAQKSIAAVKIDVEGHEAEALEGMRSTLQRDWPVVLFECNRKTEPAAADAAIEKLKDIGFDTFYSLMPAHTVIPDAVPALLRRPARVVELVLRGSLRRLTLRRVEQFAEVNYPLILAVKHGTAAGSRLKHASQ